MQWPLISSSIYFDPDFFFVQTFKHKQILLCVPWVNRVPCPVFFCVILSSLEEYFVFGCETLASIEKVCRTTFLVGLKFPEIRSRQLGLKMMKVEGSKEEDPIYMTMEISMEQRMEKLPWETKGPHVQKYQKHFWWCHVCLPLQYQHFARARYSVWSCVLAIAYQLQRREA